MRNTVTQPRVLAKVPSKSNPLKSYEIRLGGDGVVYCTCRAWITNKFCKHLEEYHSTASRSIAPAQIQAQQAPGGNAILKFFETQAAKKGVVGDIQMNGDTALQSNKIYLTVTNGIMRGVWE